MDEMSPSQLRLRALELAIDVGGGNPYGASDTASTLKTARKFYNFIRPTNSEIEAEIDYLMDGIRDVIHGDDDQPGSEAVN